MPTIDVPSDAYAPRPSARGGEQTPTVGEASEAARANRRHHGQNLDSGQQTMIV